MFKYNLLVVIGFLTAMPSCILVAQIVLPPLEAGNVDNMMSTSIECQTAYCQPGVRNRSQTRGLVFNVERQGPFNWSMANDRVEGAEQRVKTLDQLTFKFKVPVVNAPSFKALLGFEYDSEVYDFADLPAAAAGQTPTLWQILDERRLKSTKLSAYFSKSWDEKFYSFARLRVSFSGDYSGLINFSEPYRTYSGGLAFGKKVSQDKEWGVGLTFSTNQARTVAVPFFVYNITWNDHWGLESALPGQIFIRHNVSATKQNAFLLGASVDSRFYAINSLDNPGRNPALEQYFLRANGIRALLQYEHQLHPWFWAFAQTGAYIPMNNRFNPLSNVDLDLNTEMGARPFFQLGVFLTPPKELIR